MTKISLIEHEIDLEKSELLYDFQDNFKAEDWTIVRGDSDWSVKSNAIRGTYKGPELHSQIFFNKPIKGDIIMEFDAKLIAPSMPRFAGPVANKKVNPPKIKIRRRITI